MSGFFIDRPIFAWVIALVIMMIGGLAIVTLPVAEYPNVAPPAISVTAIYPGASADTVQSSVTQVIEQQMTGLDHLEYLSSTSDNSGTATITLTFAQGTNPDIAQVQVQNKLQLANPLLPQEVQQQGITVAKAAKNFLLFLALYSADDSHTDADLGDIISSKLKDPISRITGVGDTQLFGSQYAMRIWLDPYKMNNYALSTTDIKNAISAQDAQVASGQLGGTPTVDGQELNAAVNSQTRLQTPEQFRQIVLKTNADGSTVYLKDVARVELGQDSYTISSRYNGHPSSGIGIKLAPGSNALSTADAVKAKMVEFQSQLPPDVKVAYPYDTTPFVRISIEEVVKTLIEAIALVFVVMYIFLQNFRATLIPTIAVPVVLLGTFGVLAALNYSINGLTLFAMVLAIGLLVDDAIVVVENVERIMSEEGLSPIDATRKSMKEITGALVGIVLVLTAVFMPMAFFDGSTGVIYRQFSVTIVSAMVLSVLVALVLTPALCATILKPSKRHGQARRGFFGWFNRNFDRSVKGYQGGLSHVLKRWGRFAILYGVIAGVMALLFVRIPTGFLPDEDQGILICVVQLPPGAAFSRTIAVNKQIDTYFHTHEAANINGVYTAAGFGFTGQGQNTALAFVALKNWSQRHGAADRVSAIAGRAFGAFSQIRDAMVFPVVPPAVPELGTATGFDLELEDVGNVGHQRLLAAQYQMLAMAAQDHVLQGVRPNSLPDVAQLQVNIDKPHATALGLSLADVNDTLSTAWGGEYVDDFVDRGRVKHVYIEGDAPYRTKPEDLNHWYVRGAGGGLAPFSTFASEIWEFGPAQLSRYNGMPAMELLGQPAPGMSSGAATAEMQMLAKRLPAGIALEPTGLSYEEAAAGGKTGILYGLSVVVVFLCLAALYESWSVPVAVILVLPLGIIGAVLAVTLRGFNNDVFFQVGLLTTMGLAAKNAILIVEFAESAYRNGATAIDAAMEAARLRLRPILMTSFAFIAGVSPLAISSGAGSGSQNDIGTSVVGGMISATILAIFFVPLFYVLVRMVFKSRPASHRPADRISDTNVQGA